MNLYFNDEEIRLIHFHYGADTSGDCIVWFVNSGVVVTGDVFYTEAFPWVDFERGGDAVGRANTLHNLIALKEIQEASLPEQYHHWDNGIYVSVSQWLEFLFKSWEMGKCELKHN